MIRALALVLCTLPIAALAAPIVESRAPHPAAYFLGDELVQEVRISMPKGGTLDPASLPRPGPQDYWLDLRQIDQEVRGSDLHLHLRWQNFYSAVTADRREVPGLTLRLSDGSQLAVPGFSFIAAPLIPLTDDMSREHMRPDPGFYRASLGAWRALLIGSGAFALLSFAALAHHHGLWPFHKRSNRPFTKAARRFARSTAMDPGMARRILHQAFDEAAGRVLLSADLTEFLAEHPEFKRLSPEISTFFQGSDEQFFGTAPATAPSAELVKGLSRAERGLA